jgi:hypothetical protein
VQGDGDLQFVQSATTLQEAKARVRELGKYWPGDYVIENDETAELIFINTKDEN